MCDPLSCTLHLFSPTVYYWVIYSGRVARRVVISGVWPLSLNWPLSVPIVNAGIEM